MAPTRVCAVCGKAYYGWARENTTGFRAALKLLQHLVPAVQLAYPVAGEGREPRHGLAEGLQSGPADPLERALGDDVAALPVAACSSSARFLRRPSLQR
jgi:hypothetical protein